MSYDFEVSDIIPGTPAEIYSTWLDSEGHSAMTGAEAHVDPAVGGEFDAWDGYITGRTLELEPGRRIVQSWRTSEFSDAHEDSRVEVLFDAVDDGTRVTIRHTNVPEGQTGYEQGGWQDSYFAPMRAFFGER